MKYIFVLLMAYALVACNDSHASGNKPLDLCLYPHTKPELIVVISVPFSRAANESKQPFTGIKGILKYEAYKGRATTWPFVELWTVPQDALEVSELVGVSDISQFEIQDQRNCN